MKLEGVLSEALEQKQQLVLTPDMRQSLSILQMPQPELGRFIAQKICENPMLEMDTASEGMGFSESRSFETPPMVSVEIGGGERVVPSFSDVWEGSDFDPLEALHRENSFTDMLKEQIGELKLNPGFASICRYIIDCLNRRGYLEEDPSDIAADIGCPVFDVMQALYAVQSLYPSGVGARGLQECLILQLVEGPSFNACTLKIVREGLSFIAKGDLAGIMKLTGASRQDAEIAVQAIKELNPIPSRGYYTGDGAFPIVPDVIVEMNAGSLSVTMTDAAIPKLKLSREYLDMLGRSPDPEEREYLQNMLDEANSLIKAVGDRRSTLRKIVVESVALQPDFFETGLGLRPMTMRELANRLGLHISTVSRAVKGKYIICPAGALNLRDLFSSGVEGTAGEAHTAKSIQSRMKMFINAEDPQKPLSDESLRAALLTVGIAISRRTVAKYREDMGIPTSSARKNT